MSKGNPHNRHRKIERLQIQNHFEGLHRRSTEADQNGEATVATPEDIANERVWQRRRVLQWVAEGSVNRHGRKAVEVARRWGILR